MQNKRVTAGAAVAALALFVGVGARGDSITSFVPVLEHGTSATDYSAGSQFQVAVYDSGIDSNTGKGTVTFDFENLGAVQSTIANIYFRDGAYITTPISITDVSGVSWKLGSSPGSPPGATGFTTDMELDTSANNPKPSDGINNFVGPNGKPDELKLTFDYMTGVNFAEIQTALNSDKLEVAFHVINYSDGGSVTFVGSGDTPNNTPDISSAPLPKAAWGGLFLLGGIIAYSRKAGKSQLA